MIDATTKFFEELAARGHDPLLEKATGTIRFELVNGRKIDRWFVAIDKGDVKVSRRGSNAVCTLRTDKAVFDGVATGKVNPVAALLRGEVGVEGDLRLLLFFRRLFPGPPVRRRRSAARSRR